MILDTSAILAILCGEPEAPLYIKALLTNSNRLVGAPTMLEASIVCFKRYGETGLNELDLFTYKAGIKIIPFDENLYNTARQAYRRYGKGMHAANLNFGDCFSYALAKYTDEPILFKGADFSKTDLKIVRV